MALGGVLADSIVAADAGVNYQVVLYPGATHSFTGPDADELGKKFNLPPAYNAAAGKDLWMQLQDLLTEVLQ